MRFVIDSSALLAYIGEEKEAEQVGRLLYEGVTKHTLLLSAVQYGEILYTVEKWAGIVYRDNIKLHLTATPLEVVPASIEHAELAASFKARGGIAYPDCFALALAKMEKATIVTKDEEFRKFAKEVKIRWLKE